MIRIFISSTFKDFQYERDLMNKIVAPNFREESLQHGSDVELLDLRWGLNTYHLNEGDAANRVVSVCLNEI